MGVYKTKQFEENSVYTKKRGGKTIDKFHADRKKGIYPATKANVYDAANGELTGAFFKRENELIYLDHNGDYLFVEAEMFDKDGVSLGENRGWVKVSETNFDLEDPIFKGIVLQKKMFEEIADYTREENSIIEKHHKASVKDYNRRHKGKEVNAFNEMEKHEQWNYQSHGDPGFDARFKEEVKVKKESAKKVVDQYHKLYKLDLIFNPNDIELDKGKEEGVEKDYYPSEFSTGAAKVNMGYYPDISKRENANDILNMGQKWIATMDVGYDQDRVDGDYSINQIVLDIPFERFVDEHRRVETDKMPEDKLREKVNVLAVMIAHEYIHTAQNTLKLHSRIAKLPKADDQKMRKDVREILAYHFTAFPNKKYEDAKDDPVFAGTKFVRGESSIFREFPEIERAFLIWKGLSYMRSYRLSEKADITDDYKLNELEADFLKAGDALKNGVYKVNIDFTTDEEKFKTYLMKLYKREGEDFDILDVNLDSEQIRKQKEAEKKAAAELEALFGDKKENSND